mgnify:CR=1 FL=1
MKIKFENNLHYQLDAINSVVDIFNGQEKLSSNFTVLAPRIDNGNSVILDEDKGYANKLSLSDSQLLKNVQEIQLRNGLSVSKPDEVHKKDLQFSIDMETGTGKTYVFTRSIFELNKRYGMKKFIIVVPSVSIREGINKSLELTDAHFRKHFDNVPYKHFIYDSNNLSEVRDFATSDQIRIMIINIQAFARNTKSANMKNIKSDVEIFDSKVGRILLDYNDKLGAIPINLIKETNPVVIVDEPQSTMSSELQKESIKRLNPLVTFRYSATHKERINMLYKYDAIDAYTDRKVKQIEVSAVTIDSDVSDGAYVELHSVSNKDGFSASATVDVKGRNGKISRMRKNLKVGSDLYEITKLDQYFGFMVRDMMMEPQSIEFQNGEFVQVGDTIGKMDDTEHKRKMIARTISMHLDKEVKLNPKGIKVLSLFFIDSVDKYRLYDDEGNAQNGQYAQLFEEEYQKIISSPKYQTLFKGSEILEIESDVGDVHKGYFSIDKKKKASDNKESFEYFKDTSGSTKVDEDTYNLIMKDKERLLSFDNHVRFIFSHSALKEGWDNPNVFQICFLKDQGGSEIRRRQEVGRGLRIAVGQDGNRNYDESVNILTTIVNETFEEFVKGYQKELTEEVGIKFGYIESHSFNKVVIGFEETVDENGDKISEPIYLGQEVSERIFKSFIEHEYIDKKGKIKDVLRTALRENRVVLGEQFEEPVRMQIVSIAKKHAGKLEINDAKNREPVPINKAVYLSEDFKNLWDSIKYKTRYSFDFDSDVLIEKSIKSINENVMNKSVKYLFETATIDVDRDGVKARNNEVRDYSELSTMEVRSIPDIITYLQSETNLTRRSIALILKGMDKHRMQYLKRNPQGFMEQCIAVINRQKENLMVEGIEYTRIGDDAYYEQTRIQNEDLLTYLKNELVIEATKSPFTKTICDSQTERNLAIEFENSPAVKLYAKLPSWFTVATPLGKYNPDWAILLEKDNNEKLYFITESKGTTLLDELRIAESDKVRCGMKHFAAIDSMLILAHKMEDVLNKV